MDNENGQASITPRRSHILKLTTTVGNLMWFFRTGNQRIFKRGRPVKTTQRNTEKLRRSRRILQKNKKQKSVDMVGLKGSCSICLDVLSQKRDVSAVNCGHVFCTSCINKLLKRKKTTCPNCRNQLRPNKIIPLYI